MVLTFSNWPYRLFYEYFNQFNKVFCENGDFLQKILAFYKVKIATRGTFFSGPAKPQICQKIPQNFFFGFLKPKSFIFQIDQKMVNF